LTSRPRGDSVERVPEQLESVPADVAGFVGAVRGGPRLVESAAEFAAAYGAPRSALAGAAQAFFTNGGRRLWIARSLAALAGISEISIVAAPGSPRAAQSLVRHAEAHRRFALVDGAAKSTVSDVLALRAQLDSSWAALHHPWVETAAGRSVPPSGFVAGIYARTDVWKAPGNAEVRGAAQVAPVRDVRGLAAQGVNVLRKLPSGEIVLWGARTAGSDPDWRYVNIRRYFTFLEDSIEQGTQWAVFEPNGPQLWARLRATIESFLLLQWRAGALQGTKPEQAFFVHCDATTMTQADIDAGRLICLVGCAPLKPAEFVIFRIAAHSAG
jgi:phage tail sheath protein FI